MPFSVSEPRTTETLAHRNTGFFPIPSAIFYVLVLAAYWLLLIYHLGAQWSIYEQYNYGWAVPFLCGYLIWRRVQDDKTTRQRDNGTGGGPRDNKTTRPPDNETLAKQFPSPGGEGQGEGGCVSGSSVVRSPVVRRPVVFGFLAFFCLAYAATRWLHEANPIWRLTSWLWALEVLAITLIALWLAENTKTKAESRKQEAEIGRGLLTPALSSEGREGEVELSNAESRKQKAEIGRGLLTPALSSRGREGEAELSNAESSKRKAEIKDGLLTPALSSGGREGEAGSNKEESRKQKAEIGEGEAQLSEAKSRKQKSDFSISAFQRFSVWSLVFPLAFFLVAVPWPSGLETFLIQSFKQLDVAATTELLGLFGIPAVQHGNVIEISSGMVGIDEACSGIRSFQATLMISLFLGELYTLSVRRRVLCLLAGFALAFIFNVGRTFLLVYVASAKGINAIQSWHDPAGVTILVACFLGVWGLALVLRRTRTSDLRPPTSDRSSPVAGGSVAGGSVARSPVVSSPVVSGSVVSSPVVPWSCGLILPLSLFAWLLIVEAGTDLWYRGHEFGVRTPNAERRTSNVELSTSNWSIAHTPDIPGFTNVATPKAVLAQFRADESNEARWRDSDGKNWQLYYFRWLPAHALKKRVAIQLAKTHGPEKCLPAVGMTLKSYLGTIVAEVGPVAGGSVAGNPVVSASVVGSPVVSGPVAGASVVSSPLVPLRLAFQHYIFTAESEQLHVFYAIYEDQTGTEVLANRRSNAASRIDAALSGSRNYGQRFLELAVWGYDKPEDARAALERELEKLVKEKR